ncbi:MAG: twin-arginine translocase subunit TatC [Phycisphaerales bacterium]
MLEQIIDRRNKDAVMGLGEHLDELRTRLIVALLGLVPILLVALYFGDWLLAAILKPATHALHAGGQDARMQATGALETFGAYFYVSFLATLIVGGPWIIFNLWKFVAPGLYANERRFAYVLAPLSAILSAAGVAMMYFLVLPIILEFLIGFGAGLGTAPVITAPLPAGITLPAVPVLAADPPDPQPGQAWINRELNELRVCVAAATDGPGGATRAPVPADIRGTPLSKHTLIVNQLKVSEFLDLFLQLTLAFVVTFQLPVVVLLLGWAGLVTPAMLSKYRKYALLGAVVVGAGISPTSDPVSLILLASPLYLLYELSIVLLRVLPAKILAPAGGPADGP